MFIIDLDIIKQKFIEWEFQISDVDSDDMIWFNEVKNEINTCESTREIIEYYLYKREFDSKELLMSLCQFLASILDNEEK